MAAVFMVYIKQIIVHRCFEHGEILIMDIASIHTGAEAFIVADLLWMVKLDWRPLNVLVVPLLTQLPELNLIELVFHILAHWLQSHSYQSNNLRLTTVPIQVKKTIDNLSIETVLKYIGHCGY